MDNTTATLRASQDLIQDYLVASTLLAELFALPVNALTNSFVGPQCTDEALKARANSVAWLLQDSKVAPRLTDASYSDRLCLALALIARIDMQNTVLSVDLRNQNQGQKGKGVANSEIIKQLSDYNVEQLMTSWRELSRNTTALYAPLNASVEDLMSLPASIPPEADAFYKAHIATQAEKFQDKPQLRSIGDCDVGPTAIAAFVTSVKALADYHLYRRKLELFKTNCEKIAKKKKNINWSLSFGKGIEEYLALHTQAVQEGSEPTISQVSAVLVPRNQVGRIPKAAKGCLDFGPVEMKLREIIFEKIRSIFRLYGADPIDTPVFELKEVLTGKYGEDQKLIYDLKDQGGEQLGLRYDLTVPFARFCATHSVKEMRRYHIGKVYRRDEPQVAKGRLREFYQCDVDIAGDYDCMAADTEVLSMVVHTLRSLSPIIGKFRIKLSHRIFLDGVMSLAGVPECKLRAISSAVDKLDKEPWDVVEQEMCQQKGLSSEAAAKLREIVLLNGPYEEVKAKVLEIEGTAKSERILEAFKEMDILYNNLKGGLGDVTDQYVVFDASLARGLDYYTGLIYEAVLLGSTGGGPEISVGSIAGGGRYDGLIGMFSPKPIPAVGVSIGVERVFRMLETNFEVERHKVVSKKADAEGKKPFAYTNKSDVYVLGVGKGMTKEKLRVSSLLRNAGLRVEFALQDKGNVGKAIQSQIVDTRTPIGVFIGESEIAAGVVKVKQFYEDRKGDEIIVPMTELVDTVKRLLKERDDGSVTIEELLFESIE